MAQLPARVPLLMMPALRPDGACTELPRLANNRVNMVRPDGHRAQANSEVLHAGTAYASQNPPANIGTTNQALIDGGSIPINSLAHWIDCRGGGVNNPRRGAVLDNYWPRAQVTRVRFAADHVHTDANNGEQYVFPIDWGARVAGVYTPHSSIRQAAGDGFVVDSIYTTPANAQMACSVMGACGTASRYLSEHDKWCNEYNEQEAVAAAAAGRPAEHMRVIHTYFSANPHLQHLQNQDPREFVRKMTELLLAHDPRAVGQTPGGASVVGILFGSYDTVRETSPEFYVPADGQNPLKRKREGGVPFPSTDGTGGAHVEFVISHLVACGADDALYNRWEFGSWTSQCLQARNFENWIYGIFKEAGADDSVLHTVPKSDDRSGIYKWDLVLPVEARGQYLRDITANGAPRPKVLCYTDTKNAMEKMLYGPLQGQSRRGTISQDIIAQEGDRMANMHIVPEHAVFQPAGAPQPGQPAAQAWAEWLNEYPGRGLRELFISSFVGLTDPHKRQADIAAWRV